MPWITIHALSANYDQEKNAVSMTSISISKQTASIDKHIYNSRERHAPKLRSGTVRALRMNDNGCNASGRSCPHRIPL